jgi:uncharacterized protein (DUF305 family)
LRPVIPDIGRRTSGRHVVKIQNAVALLALFVVSSLAMANDGDMGDTKSEAEGAGAADKAFTAAMRTMMKDMRVRPTGRPDRDFVMMMLPHHQGAVDMAKVEMQYGKDPELLKLAGDIVAAQEREIAQMKAWLAKNGK